MLIFSQPLVKATWRPWLIKHLSPSAVRLLHESVRWLASQGRIDECLAILASIAKKNGNEVDDEVYQSFRVSCMQE